MCISFVVEWNEMHIALLLIVVEYKSCANNA